MNVEKRLCKHEKVGAGKLAKVASSLSVSWRLFWDTGFCPVLSLWWCNWYHYANHIRICSSLPDTGSLMRQIWCRWREHFCCLPELPTQCTEPQCTSAVADVFGFCGQEKVLQGIYVLVAWWQRLGFHPAGAELTLPEQQRLGLWDFVHFSSSLVPVLPFAVPLQRVRPGFLTGMKVCAHVYVR